MESIAAASGITSLTWLLIALPVAGALILLGSGRRTNAFGHLLGVATIAGSFVVAVLLWLNMLANHLISVQLVTSYSPGCLWAGSRLMWLCSWINSRWLLFC